MTSVGPENQVEQDQMTAEEYRQVGRTLAREERWEELAALLIERAEHSTTPSNRARYLVRAAQVFDKNLADGERAYITLFAAFQDDPTHEEAIVELTRMATTLNRWADLLTECKAVAAELTVPASQAAMYVAMAGWYKDQVGDPSAAQAALEAAFAADPASESALQALVAVHKSHGDHARAAAHLVSAAVATRDAQVRAQRALAAAEIYQTQLLDLDSAAEQYRRALDADPANARAATGLAEIAWEQKDWASALPLFEFLASASGESGSQTARLFQRAGWAAQMLGDNERARADYRSSHTADANYLPALLRWSALAIEQKWWQDITVAVPAVLARPDAGLDANEQLEYLEALGQAQLALGEAEGAAASFTRALEIAPDHAACREALARAHSRLSGQGPESARAIIEQQRLMLQGATSADEQVEILAGIARTEREVLGDAHAALTTYFEVLARKPDDPVTLHEALEIYTQAREWQRAVEILERLVRVETGKTRARYLVAMGNILNYEMGASERALEVYDLVLDEDSDDERTFGRIERLLTAQKAWRELARCYRRMIKRLGSTPPDSKRPLLLSIWRKLGDTCRRRLHERESAVAAYEVCIQLAPDDRRIREELAETYEVLGTAKLTQTVGAREALLKDSPDFEDMAKHIRALARLFGKHQMYDRLHCTSAALVAMGQAIPQEQAFYERTAVADVVQARSALPESLWQRLVCSPRQERSISNVLAVVSAGVAMARARDAASLGIDVGQKVDLASDRSSVGVLLNQASQLLGVALPPVYVSPGYEGELDLRIVLEGQQVVPSFVLGRNLVSERSEKDLAFFLARKLVRLRADQFLLAPEVVPSLDELRVIVAASAKLVRPEFDLPETDSALVRQYAEFLRKTVQPLTLASALAAVDQIVANPGLVNLVEWAAGANQSADRAALLFCGDAVSAVREILRLAEIQGVDAEDAVKDLIRWAVSSDYLDLREQLGLATEVTNTPPVHAPAPFPRRPYRPES